MGASARRVASLLCLLLCLALTTRSEAATVRDGHGNTVSVRDAGGVMSMPPTKGQAAQREAAPAVIEPATVPKYVTELPIPTPYARVS